LQGTLDRYSYETSYTKQLAYDSTFIGNICTKTVNPVSQIFVHENGEAVGPFSVEQINEKLQSGDITHTDLGWSQGMDQWQPISSESFEYAGVTVQAESDETNYSSPFSGENTDAVLAEGESVQPKTTGATPTLSGGGEDLRAPEPTSTAGENQSGTNPHQTNYSLINKEEVFTPLRFREVLEETSRVIVPQLEDAAAEIRKALQ
jgi:hypothetical protein